MKLPLKPTTMLLATVIACRAATAMAEIYDQYATEGQTISADDANRSATPAKTSSLFYGQQTDPGQNSDAGTPPTNGQSPNGDRPCQICGDPSGRCCCCNWGCDECPNWGLLAFAGFDSFKGVSDGSFESNFGGVTGLNAGVPIPGLKEYGMGWQLGLSYGVYDWDGWGREGETSPQRVSSQQQLFITTGFFHKARCDQRWSYGLVYDWSINNAWGEVVGNNPTMGQWRGQIEYAFNCCNGVGIWGTVRDRYGHQEIDDPYPITNRPISQVNFFWHHKFCSGADSWLYFGFPQSDRLRGVYDNGGHSLGTWTIGAAFEVPLTDSLALYTNGSYFRPSASAGVIAAMESGYDVGFGVVWYFGHNAVSHSLNGKCWTPYMPMANNSNFLVDQSEEY